MITGLVKSVIRRQSMRTLELLLEMLALELIAEIYFAYKEAKRERIRQRRHQCR